MPPTHLTTTPAVAVVGAGPAGLAAAQAASARGAAVEVFDAMPSAGRKFLLAGKGGLNLTHSEPADRFLERYGPRQREMSRFLERFDAQALREWAQGLGIETFVGTSGRVFPRDMKAAPLLRAWLHRLRAAGVGFHMRHRWVGFADPEGPPGLRLATPGGEVTKAPGAVVLALGGASWPRLGSDGTWVDELQRHGIDVAPLRPANCGFDVGWGEYFRERHAGQPIKSVVLSFDFGDGARFRRRGEFVVTATGVEGSLVYAASRWLRDEITCSGFATVHLDLLPDRGADEVAAEVARPRGSRSLATHLKSRLALGGTKLALVHEALGRDALDDPGRLSAALKALPLTLRAARPVDEAISTAGGVLFEALDDDLMACACPGVFCAGEMLDWEAPTGGYLLSGCFATGLAAGDAAARWAMA
jgi:uncharacterized flavoprotein (TIGR03862 family)